MAATLPYPSIVFVPLDVLTAEELNQMAQNITALANMFPITSADIGNAAVKSSNIDWTTMKHWVPDYANRSSFNLASNNRARISQTGFAVIEVYSFNISSYQEINVYVNGSKVWMGLQEAAAPNGARSVHNAFTIPVSAGDVITASTGLQEVNFIPGKWA